MTEQKSKEEILSKIGKIPAPGANENKHSDFIKRLLDIEEIRNLFFDILIKTPPKHHLHDTDNAEETDNRTKKLLTIIKNECPYVGGHREWYRERDLHGNELGARPDLTLIFKGAVIIIENKVTFLRGEEDEQLPRYFRFSKKICDELERQGNHIKYELILYLTPTGKPSITADKNYSRISYNIHLKKWLKSIKEFNFLPSSCVNEYDVTIDKLLEENMLYESSERCDNDIELKLIDKPELYWPNPSSNFWDHRKHEKGYGFDLVRDFKETQIFNFMNHGLRNILRDKYEIKMDENILTQPAGEGAKLRYVFLQLQFPGIDSKDGTYCIHWIPWILNRMSFGLRFKNQRAWTNIREKYKDVFAKISDKSKEKYTAPINSKYNEKFIYCTELYKFTSKEYFALSDPKVIDELSMSCADKIANLVKEFQSYNH